MTSDKGNLIDTTVVSKKTQTGGNVPFGTWTYDYDPGTSTLDDKTTVVDAEGNKKIYTHFGIRRANDGTVWKIGTLLQFMGVRVSYSMQEMKSVIPVRTTFI